MPTLRELISRLVIDDKKSTDALKRHDAQVKRSKRSLLELNAGLDLIQKAFGALRTVVRGASRAFDFLVADVAKVGDQFAKEAKKIGTSATSLQELSFAAERAGADQTKIIKAVSRMAKNLNDARAKNIGPFRDALAQLQIPITEFEGLSPDETFAKLADVIKDIEDPLVKAAIAQDIFGRSGRDLIPLLDEGSEGIQALRDRARELGLSMSDEAAAASETFVDSVTDLKAAVQGARFSIGAELIPVVTEIVGKMTDWIVANRDLIREKITSFVRRFVEVVERGIPVVGGIIDKIASFIESAGGLENVIKLVTAALVAMKLATLGAAGPWGALALAATAAGFAIMEIMAGVEGSIQSARFAAIELQSELRRVSGQRRLMERRGTLAEQQGEAMAALAAGAETLPREEFERLAEQVAETAVRRGRTEGVGALIGEIRGRRRRALEQTAETGLRGLRGRRREQTLAKAAELARTRGGGTEVLEQAIREVRGGRRGARAGAARRGGAAAARKIPKAPEEATAEELLALAEAAAPGATAAVGQPRAVPRAAAPVVTVTVNQTTIDVDVTSPITVEGVPGMDAEEMATLVVDRQANVLDQAVREAIEALQPLGVGR